jgi:hypothetical protein
MEVICAAQSAAALHVIFASRADPQLKLHRDIPEWRSSDTRLLANER